MRPLVGMCRDVASVPLSEKKWDYQPRSVCVSAFWHRPGIRRWPFHPMPCRPRGGADLPPARSDRDVAEWCLLADLQNAFSNLLNGHHIERRSTLGRNVNIRDRE